MAGGISSSNISRMCRKAGLQQQQQQLAKVLQEDPCMVECVEFAVYLLEIGMEATVAGGAMDKGADGTAGTAAAAPAAPAAMGKQDAGSTGAGAGTDKVAGQAVPAAGAAVTNDLELLGLIAGPLAVAAAAPLARGGGSGAIVGNSSSATSDASGGGGYPHALLALMPDAVQEAVANFRVLRGQFCVLEEGGQSVRSGDFSFDSGTPAAAGVQQPQEGEEKRVQQQQQLHGGKEQQGQNQEEKEQQQPQSHAGNRAARTTAGGEGAAEKAAATRGELPTDTAIAGERAATGGSRGDPGWSCQ